MDLAEDIKQYYFDNLSSLSDEKKFHFASRLYSWSGEAKARQTLEQLRAGLLPSPAGVDKLVSDLVTDDPAAKAKINAARVRQPYFDKYPDLRAINRVLFRARHLLTVYGVDIRPDILKILKPENLDRMAERLRADDEGLRLLSTYAINFLYVYKHILRGEEYADLNKMLEVAEGYDLSDKTQIQLFLYFLTHCIIGETNFYTKPLLATRMSTARKMIRRMESVLDDKYDEVNLDNKLEFLVCCRVCQIDSPLFQRVYDECSKSLNAEGYLVDTLNHNPQTAKVSPEDSEHRNVLFIMSQTEYRPHSKI